MQGTLDPGERTVPACFQCSRGERKRSTESTEEETEGRCKYDGSGPFCGAANIDLWHFVQDRSRADPGCVPCHAVSRILALQLFLIVRRN